MKSIPETSVDIIYIEISLLLISEKDGLSELLECQQSVANDRSLRSLCGSSDFMITSSSIFGRIPFATTQKTTVCAFSPVNYTP